jgi:hypothetical protein
MHAAHEGHRQRRRRTLLEALGERWFVQPWATLGLPVFGTGGATFADGTVVRDRVVNWHATVSLGLAL